MGYVIGDVLDVLEDQPDGAFSCCVTSPPYWGLRDYGHDGQIGLEQTPEEYVARMVEVFGEVRRVLRDDGTLWLNLGDSYAASAGSHRAYKPHLAGSDDLNVPRRFPPPSGLKPKDLVGIPWRVAFALQADGWYLRSDIIWHKPNPMPESVTDRPTKAHEYVFLLSKSARYYYDADAVREPMAPSYAERYAYSFGGQKNEHLTAEDAHGPGSRTHPIGDRVPGTGRNKRTVWTVATAPFSGAHFACFPPALIKPCVMAGCPEGGVVLDPFFGSGTTGMVAESLGRGWFGIELNPDYEPLIRQRTAQVGLLGRNRGGLT
uniref:site-specific DNA-methyltransferase (cytosine-N(4)-specific) n=1 Tax=viral metagenome TaxID=1070528 RepID=A0A6M3J8F3_9ZZZZ